jgi:hypothetical protein
MTPFNRSGALAAIFTAALHFGAAAASGHAATAAEVFKTHEAEIATNRCVAVGGYVFGVGRALSRQGGDAVGFSKARLLAQSIILAYATGNAPCPEGLEIAGLETIFERREAPEHYLAVVAAPETAVREAQSKGLRRQDGEDATREGPRRQDDGDATGQGLSRQDEEDTEPTFDNKGWVLQYAASLRKSIESAMDAPMPDGEGRMVVHEGEVLLSGDISFSGKITEIVLDGGEVVFSPSAEQLRGILARCEDFIANAPDDAAMPEDLLPTWRERIDFPIAVTERGGKLDVAEGEITALVAGAVRRATGVEEATLDVFGFSAIVLNRATLDPGLRITGAGQIADIGKNGSVRNRRWFDRDDPL